MPAFDGVKQDAAGLPATVLVPRGRGGRRLLLHGGLLGATALSTLVAGAFLQGVDPLGTRFVDVAGVAVPLPTGFAPELASRGRSFALAFLGFLLAHEMGHWFAARLHGLRVSLPYFVPFPPYFSLVGSLGAFIRIRSPVRSRRTLLDVGASGPWAGMAVAIPLVLVGLARSRPVPGFADDLTPFTIRFLGEPLWLGAGPLLHGLGRVFFPETLGESPILLDPLALAGWLGLFVTCLNLLPVGQLDGGHVLHALAGRRPTWPGRVALAVLLPLGLLWWGWWLWAAVAFAVQRGSTRHPPLGDAADAPGPVRTAIGVGALALLPLVFVPVPLRW